jgi:hypothetical protein
VRDALDDLNEVVSGIAGSTAPRGAVALLRSAIRSLDDVLRSMAKLPEVPEPKKSIEVKDAVAVLLSDGTKEQRKYTLDLLNVIEEVEERSERVNQYKAVIK